MEVEINSNIFKLFMRIFAVCVVSSYFFPFGFSFLPSSVNTKILLAVVGILILTFTAVRDKGLLIDLRLLKIIGLAVLFSLVGVLSTDINHSTDYAYAFYIVSFGTWISGAYATIQCLKFTHNKVSFRLLINYLVAVSVLQCILAIVIDSVPAFKSLVDAYIVQDTVASVEFLNAVERLYGIGAALDVAGTRFSVVLLAIASILVEDSKSNKITGLGTIIYWAAFILIIVLGNMISRTTTIGAGMAIVLLVYRSKFIAPVISFHILKMWQIIIFVTALLIIFTVYRYNIDEAFAEQLRFAFEGFFNLVEKGEWRTDSTDKLNNEMWIWPDYEDTKTWVIGKAVFSNWGIVGTDIGYCRFIFYSGILGLLTFSLFFIYNARVCYFKFPSQKFFFISLLVLGFVIWFKVSTDLFVVYALFHCMEGESFSKR